jgi:hypothetical protein
VTNVEVPASIAELVQGFEIYYAEKTLANSVVITFDQLHYIGEFTLGPDPESNESDNNIGKFAPTGGPWELSGFGDSFGGNPGGLAYENFGDHLVIDYTKAVGHALDLLYGTPGISPDYIELAYKVKASSLNNRWIGYNNGTAIQGSGSGNRGVVITAVDFGNGTNAGIPGTDEIFSVSNFRYVPGGILDEEFDNIKSESKVYFEVDSVNAEYQSNFKALQYVRTAGEPYELGSFANGEVQNQVNKVPDSEAWIFSYNNLLSDVHDPYSNQNLVRTKHVNYNISGAGVYELLNNYGGDVFVSYQSVLCSASVPTQIYRSIQAADAGVRNFIAWTAPSNNNWSFRHEVTESIFSQYYPKTSPEVFALPEPEADGGVFLWGPEETALYNDIRYNDDYSRDNNLVALNIFDPQEEFAVEFPNLIIRSAAQSPDVTAISWRVFLANDRYTTDTSKGAVTNLQGVANEHLIIHQEDSLYITRDRTTIQGDVTSATLGAGDIFQLTPKEIVTSQDGHAGTQHRFSCRLTKAGYTFFDLKQGKWFLLQGISDLKEISLNGFRNFFRDEVDKTIQDNPFWTTGITVAYDEKYNRIIQSFINQDKSFCVSYAPEINGFASFHDYKPNVIFTTRSNRIFSVNNGFDHNLLPDNLYFGLYEHNVGVSGIYYNVRDPEPVPFPMILDLVYNQDNYQKKVIQTIEWTSEVYDDQLSEFYRDETFDYITVRTATKASLRTELERLVNLTRMHNSNTRRNESVWSFNAIRDVARNIQPIDQGFFTDYSLNPVLQPDLISWYNRGRFLDQYCIYRLEYGNLLGRRILLLDHTVNARLSFR